MPPDCPFAVYPPPHRLAGSCVVYVPVDVVKERLQVQRSPSRNTAAAAGSHSAPSAVNGAASGGVRGIGERAMPLPLYRGSADTLKTILRTEGPRGIYKVGFSRSDVRLRGTVVLSLWLWCVADRSLSEKEKGNRWGEEERVRFRDQHFVSSHLTLSFFATLPSRQAIPEL